MSKGLRCLERPLARYSPTCRQLSRYVGGEDALSVAHAAGGEFIVVFQVRPLELLVHWLGIPFRPLHPPLALIHDPVDGHYIGFPASLVPGLTDGVLRGRTPLGRMLTRAAAIDPVLQRMADAVADAVPTALRVSGHVAGRMRQRLHTWRVA